MIAPTKIYDKFPTISPAQAADLVIKAMVEKPHEINTLLGNAGAVAHTVAPKAAFRVLNMAYHVFPDSRRRQGQVAAAPLRADRRRERGAGARVEQRGRRPSVLRPGCSRACTSTGQLGSAPPTGRTGRRSTRSSCPGRAPRRTPATSSASTSCVAVTPEPQYAATVGAAGRADRGVERRGARRRGRKRPSAVEVARRRHVDRAGDAAGDRVDRLGLAAVALGGPGVDETPTARHVGRRPRPASRRAPR